MTGWWGSESAKFMEEVCTMAVDKKMSKHLRRHGPAVDHSLRSSASESDPLGQSAAQLIDHLGAQVEAARAWVDGVDARIGALEAEVREQASGSQDGYLLDVANRLRNIVSENGS